MKTGIYIHYSEDFDNQFRYDEKDLGVICSREGTIFKIWCPLADRVVLHLYKEGSDVNEYTAYDMISERRGVWSFRTKECLHGTYYDYTVTRDGQTIRTADPYAVACGVNGLRSMVVDLTLTDPDGFQEDKAPEKETENIIYELHIKDFSFDPDSGVPSEYRGKYKAFTVREKECGIPIGVSYLKDLGITHVHLLPLNDFGWLDETGDDGLFNWGYDPVNYNVPEGSFATNPYDGVVRIRECKEMVQALHQAGIRVIMDVVYNHTYESDSWLERMVPGYYNRRWKNGELTNGSACGNDIACGRAMVDNYIADSVMYWAKEYHMDGFRFDLMGLLTVELMNRIRKELDEAFGKDEKLLYGEPWRAGESPMEEGTHAALKSNIQMLAEGIAVFSDDTRDVIKGHVFYEKVPGFVNGGNDLEERILGAVSGWCGPENPAFRPKSPAQIINYVSAHDNLTLWDKLLLTIKDSQYVVDYTKKYGDILEANKLAALIYFTCQGHIFFQAGEEFGRTKFGDDNSYRSDPALNMIRWNQTVEFAELVNYYKGLISLRKKLPGFYDKTSVAPKRIRDCRIWGKGLVSFWVDNAAKEDVASDFSQRRNKWKRLFIAYNSNKETKVIPFPVGNWVVLADKYDTDCEKKTRYTADRKLIIEEMSGIILGE